MLLLAIALVLAAGSSAVAQTVVDDEPADTGSTPVDADAAEGDAAEGRISDTENENRIDRAVLGLLIIAFTLAVLTLLFWWHTQPQRRARALARHDEAAPVVDDASSTADDPAPRTDADPESPQRPVPQGAEHG